MTSGLPIESWIANEPQLRPKRQPIRPFWPGLASKTGSLATSASIARLPRYSSRRPRDTPARIPQGFMRSISNRHRQILCASGASRIPLPAARTLGDAGSLSTAYANTAKAFLTTPLPKALNQATSMFAMDSFRVKGASPGVSLCCSNPTTQPKSDQWDAAKAFRAVMIVSHEPPSGIPPGRWAQPSSLSKGLGQRRSRKKDRKPEKISDELASCPISVRLASACFQPFELSWFRDEFGVRYAEPRTVVPPTISGKSAGLALPVSAACGWGRCGVT